MRLMNIRYPKMGISNLWYTETMWTCLQCLQDRGDRAVLENCFRFQIGKQELE